MTTGFFIFKRGGDHTSSIIIVIDYLSSSVTSYHHRLSFGQLVRFPRREWQFGFQKKRYFPWFPDMIKNPDFGFFCLYFFFFLWYHSTRGQKAVCPPRFAGIAFPQSDQNSIILSFCHFVSCQSPQTGEWELGVCGMRERIGGRDMVHPRIYRIILYYRVTGLLHYPITPHPSFIRQG